jgi:very-short-patch-repair endonuclease
LLFYIFKGEERRRIDMLIKDQMVEVGLTGKRLKYYENLGYQIPRIISPMTNKLVVPIGTTIMVNINDLSKGSKNNVQVKCDYCGKTFPKSYLNYNAEHRKNIIKKDCCKECWNTKLKEITLLKYNVENATQLEEVKLKRKKTVREKYDVEYVCQYDEFKLKRAETCIARFNVKYPSQSAEVIETRRKNNLAKYGVESPIQLPEIQEKVANSLFKNGTVRTSSQQYEIYNLLLNLYRNIYLNYPVSRCNLDVALFIYDTKIDIEYDGSYWHQDKQKDRKRDEFLKTQGWKILRIRSGQKVPTLIELQNSIEKLINTNRNYTQITLDDWKEKEKEVI